MAKSTKAGGQSFEVDPVITRAVIGGELRSPGASSIPSSLSAPSERAERSDRKPALTTENPSGPERTVGSSAPSTDGDGPKTATASRRRKPKPAPVDEFDDEFDDDSSDGQ